MSSVKFRGIAERRPDSVVLAGGDGTLMRSLSALHLEYGSSVLPSIALVPAGTVDTIARNTASHVVGRKALVRLASRVADGSARSAFQSTLRVRDDRGGDRIGFMFGAGLVSRFFDLYNSSPRQGRLPAAVLACRVSLGSLVGSSFAKRILEPELGTLRVNGDEKSAVAWSLVLASVLPDVGLHLRVAYRAREEPGRFHVVASALRGCALALQLPRVVAGFPMRGANSVDELGKTAEFVFGNSEGVYVLDGDVFQARRVDIGCGPEITLLTL